MEVLGCFLVKTSEGNGKSKGKLMKRNHTMESVSIIYSISVSAMIVGELKPQMRENNIWI